MPFGNVGLSKLPAPCADPLLSEMFISVCQKVYVTDVSEQRHRNTRAHAHTPLWQGLSEWRWREDGPQDWSSSQAQLHLLKKQLTPLCDYALFPARHHGWDCSARLLLWVHRHFSGAYPRFLLPGWQFDEAVPWDRGRELHFTTRAVLCAGFNSDSDCEYRELFEIPVTDS